MKEMSLKDMKDMLKQFLVLHKETDEKSKETDERIEKGFQELVLLGKETDKRFKETDRMIDKIGKQLWNIGFTQWEVAEDLISRNVKRLLEKRWMNVKEIKTNEKKSREYDIIVENGKEIVLVEVKNKVRQDDIDKFIEKQIPAFKKDYPKYKNKKIYGWIWWLVFRPDLEKNAEKKWLYVFTQNWEGGAVIVNKKKFKPKVL